jgi:8-oxo-dGTP pyrophosphatase MutT (NUDIX family)
MAARAPQLLARGPWSAGQVEARWLDREYEPSAELSARADAEVEALRERGSPCHDGVAARLAGFEAGDHHLRLELQPARWALRLVEGDTADSLTALCVVRSSDGRWLAGRRAAWLSTWAGRWALGAGGAVDVGESPAQTLTRELHEEWQLTPEDLSVEALISLPTGLTMLVGLATVAESAQPVPDDEHDEFAWWPSDVNGWPDEADGRLRLMGSLLASARERE